MRFEVLTVGSLKVEEACSPETSMSSLSPHGVITQNTNVYKEKLCHSCFSASFSRSKEANRTGIKWDTYFSLCW
jgi:hypothetical protein